jgi:hypothetical protein
MDCELAGCNTWFLSVERGSAAQVVGVRLAVPWGFYMFQPAPSEAGKKSEAADQYGFAPIKTKETHPCQSVFIRGRNRFFPTFCGRG